MDYDDPTVPEEARDPEPQPEPSPEQQPVQKWDWEQCQGTTKTGAKCTGMIKTGTKFCRHHQPLVDVVPTFEKREGDWPQYVRQAVEKEVIKRHKPYPFHDGGVNENAAIRMVAMVHPDCPMDSNPEILKRDGTSIPNPRYNGEPNCQLKYQLNNQGRWDVARCIKLGHDPYFTVFRKTRVEETTDSQGYVTGTRERIMRERRLNIIQVSDNPRHSSRMELLLAMARGSVPLDRFILEDEEGEFVYDSPCEFRQCSQPWTITTRYGRYCDQRHARLIAADFQRKMLPIGGDPYTEDQSMQEREDILSSLSIGEQ